MSEQKTGQKPADAKPEQEQKPGKPVEKKRARYFVVNPSGAVHEVTREHAESRLSLAGWRMATEDEIARYEQTPVQSARAPIAPVEAPSLDGNGAESE